MDNEKAETRGYAMGLKDMLDWLTLGTQGAIDHAKAWLKRAGYDEEE